MSDRSTVELADTTIGGSAHCSFGDASATYCTLNVGEESGRGSGLRPRVASIRPAPVASVASTPDLIRVGQLTLDRSRYAVWGATAGRLSFTPTEFDLLCFLHEHRGRVISTKELLRAVLGSHGDGGNLWFHVSNIRKKLARAHIDPSGYIDTVRGRGYAMREGLADSDDTRTAPGSVGFSAQSDDELLEHLRVLSTDRTLSAMDLVCERGRSLLEYCYGGDREAWRNQKRSKGRSLRQLAQQPGWPLSHSSMNDAVAVSAVVEDLPFLRSASRITGSHVVSVLGLPAGERRRWLRRAIANDWSVRELKRALMTMPSPARGKSSAPPRRAAG